MDEYPIAAISLARSMMSTKVVVAGILFGEIEVKKYEYRRATTKNFRNGKPNKKYLDRIRWYKKQIKEYKELFPDNSAGRVPDC